MGKVVVDLTMSLDGFITGPDDNVGLPLGEGVRLFEHLDSEKIELEGIRLVESPDVTHLRFRVQR